MKMRIVIHIILSIAAVNLCAQQERMEKDLEITANILQAALDVDHSFGFSSDPVDATFRDNYGVIYDVNIRGGGVFDIIGVGEEGYHYEFKGVKDSEVVIARSDDPQPANRKEDMVQQVKDFLADYAHLNRSLQDNHSIMVKLGNRRFGERWFSFAHGKKQDINKNITIQVAFSDVSSYQDGEISRDDLFDRIQVDEKDVLGAEPEFEIFGNVLEDVFSSSNSNSYYMNGSPNYERIEDLGIKYYLRVYSSYRMNSNRYRMPTLGLEDISDDERNSHVEDLYPVFVDDFKKAILDYGSILKNIEDDEPVSFVIRLTQCDCEIAEQIEVSVTKEIIEQYRNDELSESDALSKIMVTEQ